MPRSTNAAAEHPQKNLTEILADLREGRQKQLPRRAVDFADGLMKRLLGGHEIIPLTGQELQSTLFFFMLFDGQRIHRTKFVE